MKQYKVHYNRGFSAPVFADGFSHATSDHLCCFYRYAENGTKDFFKWVSVYNILSIELMPDDES